MDPDDSLTGIVPGLATELGAAIDRLVAGAEPVTVLYSGGLDSSLVAHLLAPRVRLTLLAIGFPGAADLGAARSGAELLSLPLICREITDDALAQGQADWAEVLATLAGPDRSVALATALALEAAPTLRVLCGQGADELFLGYAHYRSLSAQEAARSSAEDLERLLARGWPVALRIARTLSKSCSTPYLDERFRAQVLATPIGVRLPGESPKGLLRAIARWVGLPDGLVERRKRAFQYGSGIQSRLRRLASEQGRARANRGQLGSRPLPGGRGQGTDHP